MLMMCAIYLTLVAANDATRHSSRHTASADAARIFKRRRRSHAYTRDIAEDEHRTRYLSAAAIRMLQPVECASSSTAYSAC